VTEMAKYDDEKTALMKEADEKGMVLRFVGIVDVENNKTEVKLDMYPKTHSFAGTQWADNTWLSTRNDMCRSLSSCKGQGLAPQSQPRACTQSCSRLSTNPTKYVQAIRTYVCTHIRTYVAKYAELLKIVVQIHWICARSSIDFCKLMLFWGFIFASRSYLDKIELDSETQFWDLNRMSPSRHWSRKPRHECGHICCIQWIYASIYWCIFRKYVFRKYMYFSMSICIDVWTYLCIYLSSYLSIYLSTYLSIHLSISQKSPKEIRLLGLSNQQERVYIYIYIYVCIYFLNRKLSGDIFCHLAK